MIQTVGPEAFLRLMDDGIPALDVRSPAEYGHSRVPEALSFPLFTDEERHQIGTLYKQVSEWDAMMKGLEFAGPRMRTFLEEAVRIAPQRQVAVYCWRGGKRSGSMAWLLDNAGFRVNLLESGYKGARRYFLEQFEQPWILVRLGGRTGSGKTRVLHALKARGEQVIDLEGLASHRGSAFGNLGLQAQPSNEFFENLLGDRLRTLDAARTIWVEDESRHIGRLTIPKPFWDTLVSSPVLVIEVPMEARIQEILTHYGGQEHQGLADAFRRITRKMGPQHVRQALELLENGDLDSAARMALVYYDRTYDYHLVNHTFGPALRVDFPDIAPDAIAEHLIQLKDQYLPEWTRLD